MRRWLLLGTLGLLSVAGASANEPVAAAVFPFEVREEPYPDFGRNFALLLQLALNEASELLLVDRSQAGMLTEAELGPVTGSGEEDRMLADALGADILIDGMIYEVEGEWEVLTRVTQVSTGRLRCYRSSRFRDPNPEMLAQGVAEPLSSELSHAFPESSPPSVAKVAQAALKPDALLGTEVMIQIPDRSADRAGAPSYSERELRRMLLEAGATLVTESRSDGGIYRIEGTIETDLPGLKGDAVIGRAMLSLKGYGPDQIERLELRKTAVATARTDADARQAAEDQVLAQVLEVVFESLRAGNQQTAE